MSVGYIFAVVRRRRVGASIKTLNPGVRRRQNGFRARQALVGARWHLVLEAK